MFIVRVTFKDGKKFFLNEGKYLVLVEEAKDAYKYNTTLEFKVSWKLWQASDCTYSKNVWRVDWRKEDVVKFEAINPFVITASNIDSLKLKSKTFDVNKQEIKIGDKLYFEPEVFERLKDCGITCSNWCYDSKGNWILPRTKEDYAKITKIRYYYRGLIDTIKSHNNWEDRYDEHSWHGCYEAHHKNMLHPIIQQLCLLEFDSCHDFTILPKHIKTKI